MATTITLPNGVRIDTTDAVADVVSLLTIEQPKAATTTPQPKAEKATAAPAPKATKSPRQARQPKAASNGKALWAEITTLIGNGDYVAAREAASVKPDTFGVQAEAAIERHMKRAAKQPTTTTAKPKARPMSESPVLDKVQPEPTKAEKRAAKQQRKAAAAKPRPAHKPDCGCVTCPKGIEQRKAAKQPQTEPKVTTLPEGKRTRKARAANQPKAVVATEAAPTAPAEPTSAERIVLGATENLKAMDVDGLRDAIKAYRNMAKRQERVGNADLWAAYEECVDTAETLLAIAVEKAAA